MLSAHSIFGQGENNIWYFGRNKRINFNSGIPVYSIEGMMPSNSEGVCTVSGRNGNLLFYTNGVTVWDRNHSEMPNGQQLMGHLSTAQSTVVVPSACDTSVYCLFSLFGGSQENRGGLYYSVVDMKLRNGTGDLTVQKNVFLWDLLSERMITVKGFDDVIWLIVKRIDAPEYLSFKVSSRGVDRSPVISAFSSNSSYSIVSMEMGKLTASGDHKYIASSSFHANPIELYEFNRETGELYNGLQIENDFYASHGICFSPDGSKLYTLEITSVPI